MIEILLITPNSVTFEIKNTYCFFTDKYQVYLNDEYLFDSKRNVLSLYDLKIGMHYVLEIKGKVNYRIEFTTLNKKPVYYSSINEGGLNDDTFSMQKAIDNLKEDEFLIIDKTYKVTSLFISSFKIINLTRTGLILGETDRNKYPVFKFDSFLNGKPLGTWEGEKEDCFASTINFLGSHNSMIYGQGKVDEQANLSDWWINHRKKRIAYRPKGVFIHTSNNIVLEGITICNTPSWNQHPFYSNNLKYLNLTLQNPFNSPTTDGIDPESCKNVLIIGCKISVGDDCIAIKSGKLALAREYKTPSSFITIRNCLMENGHAGVTLGSENSGGINNVSVSNCLFISTDRGLRIKSQRGRGNLALIEKIDFNNIEMLGVKSPFVINAFYKSGRDILDYRYDQNYRKFDEYTPIFKSFTFKNIKCEDVSYGLAYLVGLPESKIKEVNFENISVSYLKDSSPGEMAMSGEKLEFNHIGIYAKNIEKITLKNVIFKSPPSEKFVLFNVDKIEED